MPPSDGRILFFAPGTPIFFLGPDSPGFPLVSETWRVGLGLNHHGRIPGPLRRGFMSNRPAREGR